MKKLRSIISARMAKIDNAGATPKAKTKAQAKSSGPAYKPAAKHVASRKAKIAAARAADVRAIAAKRKKK